MYKADLFVVYGGFYIYWLLMIVAKNYKKYKLDLVRVQNIRWGRGDTEPVSEYKCVWKEE
jgi:hypothetical protein